MVNGAGLAMTTMDLVQPRRRPARQLPRHRRRREGRPGRGGDAADPRRPERQGDPRQHLRRHHPRRRGRPGPDRGPRPAGARRPDGRPDRGHQRGRGGRAARGGAASSPRPSLDEAAAKAVAAAKGGRGVSILIGRDTRLVVQGITGREGEFHSRAMLEYGTPLVAGRDAGQGRPDRARRQVPVFNTVAEAVRETGANTSCIFVPAAGAPDAVLEAVAAGITTIFCITEGIPALDMIPVVEEVRLAGARLIGPNCPGATSPGQAKVGHHPGLDPPRGPGRRRVPLGHAHLRGGPGDDRRGHRPVDVRRDRRRPGDRDAVPRRRSSCSRPTRRPTRWCSSARSAARPRRRPRRGPPSTSATCPKVAFIAGRTAPEGKRMGHAGAIVSGGRGTAASKVEALEAAGFRVAGSPTELPGAAARRRLPRLRRSLRPMQQTDIRYLFAFDRWATRRVLSVIDGLAGGRLGRDRRDRRPRPGLDPRPPPRSPPALAARAVGQRPRRRGPSASRSPRPTRSPGRGPTSGTPRRVARHARPTPGSTSATRACPFWQMLAHVVNHGTQHRSEAAVLLTGGRPVAGRPRHDLLRGGARRRG